MAQGEQHSTGTDTAQDTGGDTGCWHRIGMGDRQCWHSQRMAAQGVGMAEGWGQEAMAGHWDWGQNTGHGDRGHASARQVGPSPGQRLLRGSTAKPKSHPGKGQFQPELHLSGTERRWSRGQQSPAKCCPDTLRRGISMNKRLYWLFTGDLVTEAQNYSQHRELAQQRSRQSISLVSGVALAAPQQRLE